MPQYDSFEEVPVWQEAARLYNAVWIYSKSPTALSLKGFAINSMARLFPSQTTLRKVSSVSLRESFSSFLASLAALPAKCVRC
jgi:hypothetical protein